MPFISANNLNIFYTQQGQGPNLILIGGLTANHLMWNSMVATLAQHFTVTRLDNRAAGQSTVPDKPFTLYDMAKDVIALMDALHIKSTAVLGHSMGGSIVQALLLNHTNRITKAIISSVSAKVPIHAVQHIQTTSHLMDTGLSPHLLLEVAIPWLYGPNYLHANNIQDIIVQMIATPYPQTKAGYDLQVQAVCEYDARRQLKSIHTPTMIIHGADDSLIPLTCAQFIHLQIRGSQLKVFPGVGHMLHIECPSLFTDAVLDFLQ